MLKALAGSSWGHDKETLLLTYNALGTSIASYAASTYYTIVQPSTYYTIVQPSTYYTIVNVSLTRILLTDFSSWSNFKHILFIYYVTVYMCIITISNTGIFCYSFLVVVLLMKYLLKTDTICSYNNNESFLCTHMLLKHVDSKITAFLSSVLLCICSFTVVNIPSIRFPMLHVCIQLYTCISTCLDKCTVCFVVRPVCMVHLSFMLYLLCIHLYYVSFRTVYKRFVYYISKFTFKHIIYRCSISPPTSYRRISIFCKVCLILYLFYENSPLYFLHSFN